MLIFESNWKSCGLVKVLVKVSKDDLIDLVLKGNGDLKIKETLVLIYIFWNLLF